MAGKPKDVRAMNKDVQKKNDPILTTAIGQQLKRLYEDVAQEPIPDRFVSLLEELEKKSETDASDGIA